MSVAMEDFPRRQRITVDEYHHMAQVGLIAPDARVELIEGVIVEMPPIGSRHGAAVDRLTRLLVQAVGERAIVRCQGSIQLGDDSEPEPDFALLVPRKDFYEHRCPTAADTLLVIEVSDTTIGYDSGTKARLYARHRIPELWIVDVVTKRLQICRRPADAGYEEVLVPPAPGDVSIASLPGVSVDLLTITTASK
jgi:Uma2 family endonuclease